MTTPATQLRDPLEIINSSSRTKLKADPNSDMWRIVNAAENCLRHHPTLALDVWRRSIAKIRESLENIEDIYDDITTV